MQASLRIISTLVWVGGAFLVVQAFGDDTNTSTDQILPTYANVSYGPHARNLFDLFLAESDEPTPLVLYIQLFSIR